MQLSVIEPPCAVKPATVVAPAGTVALHASGAAGGQEIVGAWVSIVLVIVWLHVAELPQASVTV